MKVDRVSLGDRLGLINLHAALMIDCVPNRHVHRLDRWRTVHGVVFSLRRHRSIRLGVAHSGGDGLQAAFGIHEKGSGHYNALAFLQAFGNKETTLNRLRKGETNKTDLGGVLQYNNIHIAVCPAGEVLKTLEKLKASPATTRQKAKYILATDGEDFQAEDIGS